MRITTMKSDAPPTIWSNEATQNPIGLAAASSVLTVPPAPRGTRTNTPKVKRPAAFSAIEVSRFVSRYSGAKLAATSTP